MVNVVNLINIIATRGLPSIIVKLALVDTMALLDSASGLNLIKKNAFERNFQTNKKQIRNTSVMVKRVNGVVSRASGEVNLNLEIMGKEFNFLFIIIDEVHFPTDVLLGYKSMKECGLVNRLA